MKRCWLLGHHSGGILELLCCIELALGVDDLGPLFALGFGLPGHGSLHAVGQFHVLYLDDADLDAPRFGLLVNYLLELLVDLVAVNEQLIQIRLAQHRSQTCLRNLPGSAIIVFHLDDGARGVEDAIVRHGIDPNSDIVSCDRLLGRDVQGDHSQVYLHHAIHERDDQKDTWSLGSLQSSQAKDYAALIFLHNLDCAGHEDDQQDDGRDEKKQDISHSAPSYSVSPSCTIGKSLKNDYTAHLTN